MEDFEVETCHDIRDGHAAVILKDRRTGATVMIEAIPFVHDPAEDEAARCARIQSAAFGIANRAAEALRLGAAPPRPGSRPARPPSASRA